MLARRAYRRSAECNSAVQQIANLRYASLRGAATCSMTPSVSGSPVPGFSLLRLLSERDGSEVYLAKDASGTLCALKLKRPREEGGLAQLAGLVERLQPLSGHPGLLPILSFGDTENGWLWKSFPLADNLPGLPPLEDESGLQQYTPLTLRAWSAEHGPAPAELVGKWGARLADALAVLHAAGFVHRDVKPANILMVNSEPCLGDYGLVGEPGCKPNSHGTEGYRPLEGTSDAAGDLFALGKTLYETWTARDRLEFPSLPRGVLDAPDWNERGSQLNEIILRACHAQPRKRFSSATELSLALSRVVSGHPPLNRRRWLLAGAGLAIAGAAAVGLPRFLRAPARVVWRRVRQKGFNVELWQGHLGTADWTRGKLYSLAFSPAGCVFQSVDLHQFNLEVKVIQGGPKADMSTILHPQTRELWAIEGGRGGVFALDLETERFRALGGGPDTRRHYSARTYWNPVTERVGVFGGYGFFAVRNERSEFDSAAGRWIQLEPDRDAPGPWRRTVSIPLVPDADARRIFLVGGYGSPSGKQGEMARGLEGFDGRFHYLDDLWELDLQKNTWRCLLPFGHLDPQRLRAAAFLPRLEGMVLFEGMRIGGSTPGPAQTWLFRPNRHPLPVRLPAEGEPSRLGVAWAWALDPSSHELVMFADDGIFRISVDPA